jgi:N-acetylglucosaminyl-diphospho-decaprenol L-rhamnosyltransferase
LRSHDSGHCGNQPVAIVSTHSTAVAIVSFNTASLLRRCVQSVVADTSGPVLVVDNHSSDGSVELLRTEFPSVHVRAENKNCGYGAAANLAVAELGTPYVLLLNADTELAPGAVAAMATYLDQYPKVGMVGPRVVTAAGRFESSVHRFPTPLALLVEESGLRRLLRATPRNEWISQPADWVLGAALAIRRQAFEAVGGFDEAYFLYHEEVDLSYRLWQAGWEVHYAPVTTVRHIGGASTSQSAVEAYGQYVRSTLRFARLRLPRMDAAGVRVVLAAALVTRLGRDAIQLAWTRDPGRRARLLEQTAVWSRGLTALREQGDGPQS